MKGKKAKKTKSKSQKRRERKAKAIKEQKSVIEMLCKGQTAIKKALESKVKSANLETVPEDSELPVEEEAASVFQQFLKQSRP